MSAVPDTAADIRKIKLIDWAILAALGACGAIALQMNNRLIELNTTVAQQSETMRDQAVEIKGLRDQVANVNVLATRVTALELRTTNVEQALRGAR